MEPRPGDPPRLHLGDDVVAAMGTPIRAPIDGVLTYETSDPQSVLEGDLDPFMQAYLAWSISDNLEPVAPVKDLD